MMNEDLIRQTVEAVLSGTASHTVQSKTEMSLSLATALIARIEQKAAQQNMAVVVAVADKAGRPVAIHCMDGAYIGSFDIALNKSYTSAAFKMSTKELGELSRPDQSLYGIQFTNQGKVVIFGGGEPLKSGDEIIGALGVSGGTAKQDTDLAAYGREVLKEVISCLR
jgi:uncharacterized protein GlcG (DUF336 family)